MDLRDTANRVFFTLSFVLATALTGFVVCILIAASVQVLTEGI